jgi:hypothetical protein
MQHIILVHTNKKIQTIHLCYLYDFDCPRSMIPTHNATCSSVPLWTFLVSINLYFILNLVEVI